MMNSVDEIYDAVYAKRAEISPEELIEITEPHLELLKKSSLDNYDLYFKSTRLLADYAIGLARIDNFSEAIKYLDIAINRFDNDPKLKSKNLWEEPMFESLVWFRGVTNFYLKDFRLSKIDFQNLVEQFPDNDKYGRWLKACVNRKYSILEWIFGGFTFLSIALSMYLNPEDGVMDTIALYGIVIGLVGGLTSLFMQKR